MEPAVKKAIGAWNKYVEDFPESRINKAFLSNNEEVVSRIVDAVVPDVMDKLMRAEDKIEEDEDFINALMSSNAMLILESAAFFKVTASEIDTYEELDDVNEKAHNMAVPLQYFVYDVKDEDVLLDLTNLGDAEYEAEIEKANESDEDVIVISTPTRDVLVRAGTSLPKPLWLVSTTLPSGRLQAVVLPHNQFTEMANEHVVRTPLGDSILMQAKATPVRGQSQQEQQEPEQTNEDDSSIVVDKLFDELGFTVSEN